jgi:F-type H+-transporting ATPase subunit delta
MLKGGVAKRYANALFEVAVEKQLTDRFTEDVTLISNAIQESAELRDMLRNPTIPATLKEQVVTEVFGQTVHELVLNFMRVLIHRRREAYIFQIADELKRLNDLAKGRVKVFVESAVELSDKEIAAIREQLSKGTREVEISTKVNPSLIGGVRLTIGDRVIDASVKTQLNQFRSQFVAGGLR